MTEPQMMRDPIADALDDMAALGEHWKRNRERGRMPNGIRSAMLLVARDVLDLQEMQQQEHVRTIAAMHRYEHGEDLAP
jgi:hypothetical protein